MDATIIIQARMGSTRLPGKVLEKASGKSMLAHLVARLRSRPCGQIVVATTPAPQDDAIVAECAALSVLCVRGSENDVLGRYLLAAQQVHATTVVRITADCPLMDPALVCAMIDEFHELDVDYLSNSLGYGLPRGQNVEVMTREALERAGREATEDYQREHVTPYIYELEGRFRTANRTWPEGLGRTWPADLSRHRWTVDTPQDLLLVRNILDALGTFVDAYGIADILNVLEANPSWPSINADIQQKSFKEAG